jgi:hypothetical protein
MKHRLPLFALALLALCTAAPALAGKGDKEAKDDQKGTSIARRVAICNSAGLVGVQDLTPFVNVPLSVEISDTTGRDTLLTSTAVWVNKPLYRLVKDRESRIDLDGPVAITVITMVPFGSSSMGFRMDYTMSNRLDEGEPQILDLHTQRGNPLYTTRVPGMTFGLPKAYEVSVPGGKHSLYLKPVDGSFDFLYAIFQISAIPMEDQRK